MKPTELKRLLVTDGFQVFRTLGSEVVLAERIRDNLVMDSGIAVLCGKNLAVRVTVKAHKSDYPGELDNQLLARARQLMTSKPPVGYDEVETAVVPISDPGAGERQIDTCYEVTFRKQDVPVEQLGEELRVLLRRRRLA